MSIASASEPPPSTSTGPSTDERPSAGFHGTGNAPSSRTTPSRVVRKLSLTVTISTLQSGVTGDSGSRQPWP